MNVRLFIRKDCRAHGWLSVWMSEWTSKPDTGREWASEGSKCRGEWSDVRVAAGDYWLHNGWRGGVGARSAGLRGAERRPQPQGTLTQRAMNMEALFRLNCGPLAAGAMVHRTREENKRQEREPSISTCILPSLSTPTALCTTLPFWPDHCYSS